MKLNKTIHVMAKKMRIKALEMAFRAGNKGAHFGAGFSSMDILAVLYGKILRIDPSNPLLEGRDRFIPSKAHCTLSFYTALAYAGFFNPEKLDTFEMNESDFGGHPSINDNIGIDFSGGSLGMGLSLGVGLALSAKRKKTDANIYVLVGDGELDEGSNWEAVMSASQFKLDNLFIVVDRNKLQYDGLTDEVMNLGNLNEKFISFGCNVYEVDGHNIDKLVEVFEISREQKNNKPNVIIANTIKGKGISFMENKKEWHHGSINEQQYEQAMSELLSEVK